MHRSLWNLYNVWHFRVDQARRFFILIFSQHRPLLYPHQSIILRSIYVKGTSAWYFIRTDPFIPSHRMFRQVDILSTLIPSPGSLATSDFHISQRWILRLTFHPLYLRLIIYIDCKWQQQDYTYYWTNSGDAGVHAAFSSWDARDEADCRERNGANGAQGHGWRHKRRHCRGRERGNGVERSWFMFAFRLYFYIYLIFFMILYIQYD